MEKVVFDTDLYIDWINVGRHEDLLLQRPFLRYMSTVVLMELRAGAAGRGDQRLVERLYETFARTGRLLSPSPQTFWEAGRALLVLQRTFRYDLKKRFQMVNDTLIALSTRQIGATLITRNARDFQAIHEVVPFRLVVVDGR